MPRYTVTLCADQPVFCDLDIEADDEQQAREKALEIAPTIEDSEWEDGGLEIYNFQVTELEQTNK
jgi:hypothetical protein